MTTNQEKNNLVERCNETAVCTRLQVRLESRALKGFFAVHSFDKDGKPVLHGVLYKQAAADEGEFIKVCPFCCHRPGRIERPITAANSTFRSLLAHASARLAEWEEREAAVCPEDVPFDEYIAFLKTESEQLWNALNEAHSALIVGNGDKLTIKKLEAVLATRKATS